MNFPLAQRIMPEMYDSSIKRVELVYLVTLQAVLRIFVEHIFSQFY